VNTYQLFAYTPVWRVVEIVNTVETVDGKPRLMTGKIGYRWTRKGADQLRNRWDRATSDSRFAPTYVVQGGIVHWVPEDEWEHALDATEWGREQNVDDRTEHGPSVTWTKAARQPRSAPHGEGTTSPPLPVCQ
jgi:hypothetical protein